MANKTGKGGQKAGEPGRNPTGANGHLKGWQRYGDRAAFLAMQYTVGDIMKLVANPVEFKKLSIRDGQILLQLANTIDGNDKRLEREALLDRIEGKPAQFIETKNETTLEHKPVSYTSEWVEETLGTGPAEPPQKPVLN